MKESHYHAFPPSESFQQMMPPTHALHAIISSSAAYRPSPPDSSRTYGSSARQLAGPDKSSSAIPAFSQNPSSVSHSSPRQSPTTCKHPRTTTPIFLARQLRRDGPVTQRPRDETKCRDVRRCPPSTARWTLCTLPVCNSRPPPPSPSTRTGIRTT